MQISPKLSLKSRLRKTTQCLNCGHDFLNEENYCPDCGQQNSDQRVSVGTMLDDFAKDYFTFDSKLIRSLVPLLFKPGYLTIEYNKGKRVRYIPPLRMYIFISLCYFFLISSLVPYESISNKTQAGIANSIDLENDSLVTAQLEQELDHKAGQQLSEKELSELKADLQIDKSKAKADDDGFSKFLAYFKQEKVSPESLLDSLKQEKTSFNLLWAKQGIKLAKHDASLYLRYVVDHLSITMFLMIPFFALLLKLFYIRTDKLYIEHLVFTMHLQSFLFVFLMICILLDNYIPYSLSGIAFLAGLTYVLLAFRNVYRQGWMKTIFKTSCLLFSYSFLVVIFLLCNLLISFLMF